MTYATQSAGKLRLLITAAPLALLLGATPAFAQDSATVPQSNTPQGTTTTSPATPATPQEEVGNDIIVTGSIIRGAKFTPSPVTTLTTDNLDKRGISTVQDAIQKLSSNNGPALTNSFTANGAFAAGASSVSLRGLSTNSTLVLFDGLRAAYYPLADDGSRNFVDLNTIPDDIVERIDVLRDGASSSYGADAIAGVVNVITKKEFKGVAGRVEAGISQKGSAPYQRVTLTAGIGDLAEKGFNAYVSGYYYKSGEVRNSDLPAPFNTADKSGLGPNATNGITNGLTNGAYAGFGAATDFFVRPYTNVTFSNGVQQGGTALGRYQKLNPATACIAGPSITLTAAQLAVNTSAPTGTICQEDRVADYGVVAPQIERFGGSAKFTAQLGSDAQAYLEANFSQTTSSYTGAPATIRGNANTGIVYPRFSTSAAASAANAVGSGILALPIYICARSTVGDCTAANGTLNPNNPFAAQGQIARLLGAFPNRTFNLTRDRVYRAAFGVDGSVFGDFQYSVNATAMHSDLKTVQSGYVYIQHLLDVIKDGSYNFVNPQLNSAATNAYVTPDNVHTDTSDLYQAQFTVSKQLFTLPGGPLIAAVGGSVYYEAVNSPSSNPDYNGPTQRYFTLNAFGTVGSRTVASAFGEIKAPVFDQLEIDGSGRYDHYSSGQSAFSPKIGFILKPVRQVSLRGTYSRGFRIPSFAEANALPTTGYVTQALGSIPQSFLNMYGAGCSPSAASKCSSYVTSYSIGETTLASPNLKPEKSRSFTAGIKLDPIPNVTITVDYYNIKKTGAITTPNFGPAISAYYAGTAIPAGITVIADAPDINNPTSKPRIGFIEAGLVNANEIQSNGIDFGANVYHNFGAFKFTSALDASLILELSTTIDGFKQNYVDTLGNFNLTAGSGTFRWKGNWLNTIESGPFALTGTVNYTSGYNYSATDQGSTYEDCSLTPAFTGNPATGSPYGPCRVKSYITVDANLSVKVNNAFTFYANVINLFDRLPPIDGTTYGAYLYNPVQAGTNIYGRQFSAGAKFNF